MPDRPGAPDRAWQRMLSGRRLDLLDPSPFDVEIADIAHGLARVARWNGQTAGDHAFSVAQHSVAVEAIFCRQVQNATPDQRLACLLHDAPEYVIGDMISPFKAVVGGDYKAIEERLHRAIHQRFALPPLPDPLTRKAIKRADQVAAYFEATLLAGFGTVEAARYFGRPNGIAPDGLPLGSMPAQAAQATFLDRFLAIEASRSAGTTGRRTAV